MGLRAGQDLKHGEQAVEALARHPPAFVDQPVPDHGDLGDGAAEGQGAEPQELQEEGAIAQMRGAQIVRAFGHHLASVNRYDP
ncbi:hypothetical protein D3C87_1595000 [compost metagenome]